jgi:hypothetical protein
MPPLWKRLAALGALASLAATLFNLVCILRFDEDTISGTTWLGMFLFCLAAYGLWLWSALMLARQFNLKRWPLWLMPVHPMVAILVYWVVNREPLLADRPNP